MINNTTYKDSPPGMDNPEHVDHPDSVLANAN